MSSLRRIEDPAVEPVTAEEVRLATRINDDSEDALLELWIKTAREQAEDYLRRSLLTQKWELTFDKFPEMPASIPRAPLVSVESVSYYDYTAAQVQIPLSSFIVDTSSEPGRIGFAYGEMWPNVQLRPMSAVRIEFTAGGAASAPGVEAAVRDAVILWCSWRYENRTAEEAAPKQFYDLLGPRRMWA